jgi:hypothetical protein
MISRGEKLLRYGNSAAGSAQGATFALVRGDNEDEPIAQQRPHAFTFLLGKQKGDH